MHFPLKMKQINNIIEQAIRSFEASVEIPNTSTENDVYVAIRQVMRDNPDIFWFSHQWSYSHSETVVRFRYPIDEIRSKNIWTQIDDVVENDFKLNFARTLYVKEQVMYVYKWVALYCNYSIHSAHNQTIYSVFVHRHSVCTGIAKATQYLLKLLGIESRLVFGKMNNSEKDSRHCWLIVNIDGQWYHLDPTFALPETEHLLHQCGVKPAKGDDLLFYNFFCVDTNTIKQSRNIEEEEFLPACNNKIDHNILQQIKVTPSRNGESFGLGCVLSNVGTTADIYLAHDKDKYNRCRLVAKVFRDDENHELLRKELIVMRECAGSPHILRAADAYFDNGILYMEQATPLSELLASHYYKLTLKSFCNLLIDVASGLKELLAHGIFYRDIHLNNIYLCEDSFLGKLTYKLGDFGSCTFADKDGKFADLTERGGVGSKWYMAPETWNEGTFDERSSVYGVGMIAYYLLNDLYPPFLHEYGEKSLDMRMQSYRLPIPSKLQEDGSRQLRMDFIINSLSNNPSERYQTLIELIDAINECKSINQDRHLVECCDFRTAAKKPETEAFCSTCEVNPSIIVSNGELDVAIVMDGDSHPDVLLVDNNADSHIDSFDTADTSSQINDFATTMAWYPHCSPKCSPEIKQTFIPQSKPAVSSSFWSRLFGNKNKLQDVYSSVFAPAEIKLRSRMMIQVYLHLNEETEKVKALASEADKYAERRDYIPLQTKLKRGDKVDVVLNINGDRLLHNSSKSIIWQGSFCKCAFDYPVPSDLDVDELSCSVNFYVNGAIVGEMLFYTQIVDSPTRLNANVIAKPVKKLFISYSHNDLKFAEKIAKLYEGMDIEVFFDKHKLKAGGIYSEEIFNFIRIADTFVLCWSENAAQSEYVEKERKAALELAYPNCRPREDAKISIKAYNIQPYATPPKDMIEHYHFEEL